MAKTYVVKSGDTLSNIALLNSTTVEKLMKLNPHIKNKNLIKPGWVITLPGNPSEGSEPVSKPSEPDYSSLWTLVEEIITDISNLPKFKQLMEMIDNGK